MDSFAARPESGASFVPDLERSPCRPGSAPSWPGSPRRPWSTSASTAARRNVILRFSLRERRGPSRRWTTTAGVSTFPAAWRQTELDAAPQGAGDHQGTRSLDRRKAFDRIAHPGQRGTAGDHVFLKVVKLGQDRFASSSPTIIRSSGTASAGSSRPRRISTVVGQAPTVARPSSSFAELGPTSSFSTFAMPRLRGWRSCGRSRTRARDPDDPADRRLEKEADRRGRSSSERARRRARRKRPRRCSSSRASEPSMAGQYWVGREEVSDLVAALRGLLAAGRRRTRRSPSASRGASSNRGGHRRGLHEPGHRAEVHALTRTPSSTT